MGGGTGAKKSFEEVLRSVTNQKILEVIKTINELDDLDLSDITSPLVNKSNKSTIDYIIKFTLDNENLTLADLDENVKNELKTGLKNLYVDELSNNGYTIDESLIEITLSDGSIQCEVRFKNGVGAEEPTVEEPAEEPVEEPAEEPTAEEPTTEEPTTEEEEAVTNRFTLIYEDNGATSWTDNMKQVVDSAVNKWNKVITSTENVWNPYDHETTTQASDSSKLQIKLKFEDYDQGILAGAVAPMNADRIIYGTVTFNTDHYTDKWTIRDEDLDDIESTSLYNTMLHEFGHCLGFGFTYWQNKGLLSQNGNIYPDNIIAFDNTLMFIGINAVEIYKYYDKNGVTYKKEVNGQQIDTRYTNTFYENTNECEGIPIEDNGGSGTAGSHFEEGKIIDGENHISYNNRTINSVFYPAFGNELMTGIDDGPLSSPSGTLYKISQPLSAITIAILEDMGYGVDYTHSDKYNLGTGADHIPDHTYLKIITVGTDDNGNSIFKVDGGEKPTLYFDKGDRIFFNQSDSSNNGHQIKFKIGENDDYPQQESYGTPGETGAHTVIEIPDQGLSADEILNFRYSCETHGDSMGNSITINGLQ